MIIHAVNEIMEAVKVFNEKLQCTRCGWKWTPRKVDPIACPHCKSYEWRGKKNK